MYSFCSKILVLLLLCQTIAAEEKKVDNNLEDSEYFLQFQEVFKRIAREYVQEPEKQKMTDAGIDGMLSSLDPHSGYFTDEDLDDFLNQTKGEFGGIGVEITYQNGDIKVISPIDDLPAYKAGIKSGDYIVKVNDDFVSVLGFNKAVKEMRGTPGTKVKLLIIRQEDSSPQEIELTREIVSIKPIKFHLEKNNIAYIRIVTFNEHTISELKKSFQELKSKTQNNIKGIILDLRNNPGGLLEQAVAVSEYFINSGVIVKTRGKTKNSNAIFSSNRFADKAPTVPLIVLINGGSASASEIVAGALKDHKRGILLGTKTFGKGSVQSLIQISPRAAIKLTVAKYYTPNNHSIQAAGIEPDILVETAKVEYKNSKIKPFSESSFKNYLKNDESTKNNNKEKDELKNTDKIEDSIKKTTDIYHNDYQFARAYDLINGLILINQK